MNAVVAITVLTVKPHLDPYPSSTRLNFLCPKGSLCFLNESLATMCSLD